MRRRALWPHNKVHVYIVMYVVWIIVSTVCLVESLIVAMLPTKYLENITMYRNVPTESYEVDIQYLDRYIYLVLFVL